MIKIVGAHCPTKFATLRLPSSMRVADAAIEMIASDKYVPDGMRAVCDSIILVTLPSPAVMPAAFPNVRTVSIL